MGLDGGTTDGYLLHLQTVCSGGEGRGEGVKKGTKREGRREGGGRERRGSLGVPLVAPQVKNLTSTHEDVGSVPGLAQGVKDPVLLQASV